MSVYKNIWFCRWCGNIYRPLEETHRDGFCRPRCKQAHHRAYHKYVTRKQDPRSAQRQRVTRKKRKSWGCAYCNIANRWNAKICINCKKPKKVGSPFSLHV